METVLGGLAFALMTAGQLLAVIAVHNARFADGSAGRPDFGDARAHHIWLLGG